MLNCLFPSFPHYFPFCPLGCFWIHVSTGVAQLPISSYVAFISSGILWVVNSLIRCGLRYLTFHYSCSWSHMHVVTRLTRQLARYPSNFSKSIAMAEPTSNTFAAKLSIEKPYIIRFLFRYYQFWRDSCWLRGQEFIIHGCPQSKWTTERWQGSWKCQSTT